MVIIKRKVIQIANSTQLISLPRPWAKRYGIKKGDELEVEEQGNKILISTEAGEEIGKIEIDITDLDRTTILYYIQALYRAGYDEIKVRFNKPTAWYFRLNEERNISTILHTEINRLVGYEIVQQKENFCIIKNLSKSSIQEFDSVLRRIFLLLNDTSSDLVKGAKEINLQLIQSIEEKHDSITKFVSYCLRLLNKQGYSNHRKTLSLYNIISNIDSIIDVLKNAGRDLQVLNRKLDSKTIRIFDLVNESIHLYSTFFFKFDLIKSKSMHKSRDEVVELLFKYQTKIQPDELVLISRLEHAFELLIVIKVARVGIEYL